MSAAVPQIFYNSPWRSPLYQTLNVLLEYYHEVIKSNDRTNILNKPAFELLSETAASIFDELAVDDREIAMSIGKDLLQTAEKDDYEILLNGALKFRYNFDPDNRFSRTADNFFTKDELEKYIQEHQKKPESNDYLQQAQLDLQSLETKPPELQIIEQLFHFLTTNSCTVNSQQFLFILLGIQQSNASGIMKTLIRLFVIDKIDERYWLHISSITPFINKTIFNIQCDPSSRRLTIHATLKYYLKIITDQGEKKLLFPFELTDIVYDLDLTVYDLDLTDIKNEKPGLTLQAAPVNQLVKIFSDCYDIIKRVPNVINTRGEIDYNVFKTALEQKIKYRTEGRGQAVEERMALKGFMGGKRQKKTRIRRVSKKKFYSYKRSRRQRNKRKSKQNK
jgi:hypothetical protein